MSNSSRSSRHAPGILPAKQFFNLRKPIRTPTTTFSLRPKSPASSSSSNDTSTSSQPTTYSSSQTRLPFTSVVRSSLSTISSEGKNPSKSSKQPSIAMTALPLTRDTTPNPSVDSILASTSAITDDNTSPNRPPSALLTRRQQRSPGNVEDIPQVVIDSVLEPKPSSLSVLEPAAVVTTLKSSSSTSGYPAELIRHPAIHRSLSQKKLPPIPSPTSQDSSTTHNSFLAIPYNSTRPMSRITFHPPPISSVGSKGRKRVYQVWPGRNKFFLGGRIITSRDFPAFLVAVATLVMPCGLFFGFTAPFLYTHLSPAVVFIFIYLFLLSLTSMLITSWTDPGIVSRNLDPSPPTEEFDESDNFFNQSQYPYYPSRIFPLQKDIKINGQATRLKYCDTCRIYRPPRCSHCRQCDNCVENEDHHCIWLNNCIGRRNYRSFFTFIVTATVICVYIFSFCTAHIVLLMKEQNMSFGRALGAAPISFVLVLLALFLVWSVGGLTGYHIYLISNNMTTHEQLRTPLARSGYQNPFDFGNHYYNCFWVLCRPLVQSYINRRGFVETEESDDGLGEGTSSVPQMASQQLQMTSTSTAIDITTIAGPSSREQQNAVNV